MSFTPPTPKRKNSFQYMLPIRLVMVKHNCMFCDKNCEDGIYDIYVDKPNLIGYQFCKNCKAVANKCVKKYCSESKIVLLTLLFEDFDSILEKTFNIPRSNGDIEKWCIECETVVFNNEDKKWYIYFCSTDFKFVKGVNLEKVFELNKNSPEIQKIANYIQTNFS